MTMSDELTEQRELIEQLAEQLHDPDSYGYALATIERRGVEIVLLCDRLFKLLDQQDRQESCDADGPQ